jgi:hypothetical protein
VSGEVIMRTYYSVALAALVSVVANMPALAEADLTGRWVGQFKGIQVEIPLQPGPFGYRSGDSRKAPGPRFGEATLQMDFEIQREGLAAGTWNAGEFKQKFVCAQTSQTQWSCVDAGGRASVEVKSGTEIKVCYLDNREGAQGAGCALLRKSG